MQIKQLEFFLTIAETKSLSKAAEQLFISRQALSQSLTALENEMGFSLFQRHKTGLILTLEGEHMLNEAKIMLESYKRALAIPQMLAAANAHNISVVSLPFFGHRLSILSDVFIEVKKRYPQINFAVYESNSAEMFDNIKKYNATIALKPVTAEHPLSVLESFAEQNGYALKIAAVVPFSLVINCSHPLASQDYITLDQLKNFSISLRKNHSLFLDYLPYFNQQAAPYYVSHPNEALYLVAKNIDIAAIESEQAVRYSFLRYADKLKFMPIKGADLNITYYMIYRPIESCSEIERTVIKMTESALSDLFPG